MNFDVVLFSFEYAAFKRDSETPINFFAMDRGYQRVSTYG